VLGLLYVPTKINKNQQFDTVLLDHVGAIYTERITKVKREGFLLQLKKDKIEEYKKHHEAVWPEMLEALRKTGWHNYSLFLRDDGLLFGYFEAAESIEASLAAMAKEEINARWQEFMGPYFESIEGRPDENMITLEEVFHLD
jgi:L-rhamnose mutarotase